MLANIRSIPNKRHHKKKKEDTPSKKNKFKSDKKSLANSILSKEEIKKRPLMSSNNKEMLDIKISNHFNENIMIEINKSINRLLGSKKLAYRKLDHIIEIIDGCLTKENSIHVLNTLHPLYYRLLISNYCAKPIYPKIIQSLYMFMIKLKDLRKKISVKELISLEKSLLTSIEFALKNYDVNKDQIKELLTILNYHILYANKQILSKYLSIYLRINIIYKNKKLIYIYEENNELDKLKKALSNKINLFPELLPYLSLIK